MGSFSKSRSTGRSAALKVQGVDQEWENGELERIESMRSRSRHNTPPFAASQERVEARRSARSGSFRSSKRLVPCVARPTWMPETSSDKFVDIRPVPTVLPPAQRGGSNHLDSDHGDLPGAVIDHSGTVATPAATNRVSNHHESDEFPGRRSSVSSSSSNNSQRGGAKKTINTIQRKFKRVLSLPGPMSFLLSRAEADTTEALRRTVLRRPEGQSKVEKDAVKDAVDEPQAAWSDASCQGGLISKPHLRRRKKSIDYVNCDVVVDEFDRGTIARLPLKSFGGMETKLVF
eukprot:TRINITY_DN69265_c0_g1_i1.p1 TRINITY_DN69265_c0_g1~~TRINITY_DN69265_c0_g1_i1.p1  ORF type:complete len:289 (-),score=41.23 TRINITY_DN69265_c0_g1_i1:64-930(-)